MENIFVMLVVKDFRNIISQINNKRKKINLNTVSQNNKF